MANCTLLITLNLFQNLKVLRHPCIVKFLGWTKSNDGHRLITEPVTPLELQLDSLTSLEICAGLHDVARALSFLHERVCSNRLLRKCYSILETAKLEIYWHSRIFNVIKTSFFSFQGGFCHNNVSISTIFVSDDGSWKLGCMEHVCR